MAQQHQLNIFDASPRLHSTINDNNRPATA
jgi:hypothetical protein